MLQVLHIINSLETGGAETNLLRLIKGLDTQGINCCVWPLRRGGALTQAYLDAGIRLCGPGSVADVDLVHGWLYAGCVAASLRAGKRPTVWGIRHVPGNDESVTTRLSLWLMKNTFRADLVVCNSQAAEKQHKQIGVRANTWQVINNGISPAVINARSRADLRFHLGLEENDILLLQVARLHPHKGQRLLLEAVQPLLDKYSHVKLLFVGRGCDKLPANSQIHVVDGSDDLAPFYNAADWLINPSLSESFPTVVLEAMSYGIPVVATDVGGTRELLDQAGVLVAATSTDLMLAIDKAIHMDSQERNHYVAAGLERSSQFSFKRMVTNYASAYRQIFEASEKRSG